MSIESRGDHRQVTIKKLGDKSFLPDASSLFNPVNGWDWLIQKSHDIFFTYLISALHKI